MGRILSSWDVKINGDITIHESKRIEVMQKLVEKRASQAVAANLLQISVRQVKRLLAQYRQSGASGLISKRLGKPSNRRLPPNIKELCLALIEKHFYDFGPTFAKEKLKEIHQIDVFSWNIKVLDSSIDVPSFGQLNPKKLKFV